MKAVTDFIKSNPVVVVSAVIVVAALTFLFLVVSAGGKSLVQEVEKRKQTIVDINNLKNTTIEVPGEKPDDPQRSITIVANKPSIEKLSEMYAKMEEQYEQVTQFALNKNQMGHAPMMEGLLPKPTSRSALFTAKEEYKKALHAMLSRATALDDDAPRLNAGPRPAEEEFYNEIQKVEDKFLASFIPRKAITDLSIEEQKRLASLKMDKALDMVTDVARRIYIYADTDPLSPEYPFDVGMWAADGPEPTLAEIWEGQMNLWIQQDIVRAIQQANSPIDEKGNPIRNFNVLRAPVKHLMKIRVNNRYVGINTSGSVNTFAVETSVEGADERVTGPRGQFAAARRTAEGDVFNRQEVSEAFREEIAKYNDNPGQRLPEMFQHVPSGRVSNAIYDVRHVTLDAVVDFQQLPRLFEAIGDVNFMTVLNVNVSNVDEYDALKRRYAYGDSDCVRVQILIESIWFRDWTKKLMPDMVKTSLGIRTEEATPTTTTTP